MNQLDENKNSGGVGELSPRPAQSEALYMRNRPFIRSQWRCRTCGTWNVGGIANCECNEGFTTGLFEPEKQFRQHQPLPRDLE